MAKLGQKPNLASDYHLFRSLNNDLKDRKFENEDELKRYLHDFFDSKPEEFYASGICDLRIGDGKVCDLSRHWSKVIDTNGEYTLD